MPGCASTFGCAGLDLMDVLAKLGVFASSYAFSLVNQIFIQRVAADLGTKHLMTLGLPQIVNALRRHGCGLAEHVVHTAYQLLARQFSVLCQVRAHNWPSIAEAIFGSCETS